MEKKLWQKRWKKAVRVAWLLRSLPFVRLVGLNGSMSYGTMQRGSDIDLFVVIEAGHLYLGRLLVTGVVRALNLHKRPHKQAGKVCLNRYATSHFLEITEHSSYHARGFHNLFPLYAAPGVYEEYVQVNSWMREYDFPIQSNTIVLRDRWIIKNLRTLIENILERFPSLEEAAYIIQKERLFRLAEEANFIARPVINDKEVYLNLPKEAYH